MDWVLLDGFVLVLVGLVGSGWMDWIGLRVLGLDGSGPGLVVMEYMRGWVGWIGINSTYWS